MPSPRVAVVVAARDAADGVAALCDALAAQTLPVEEFEVAIVDDGSRDGTADAARRSDLNVRVERLERSRGAYVARNRGLALTSAPVVALTDSDCRPAADWLERGLAALDAQDTDLVGGRIEMALSERPTLAESVDVARGLDQRRCVVDWGFAATANVFVRRAVIDAIGPFNEQLRSGGDDEFSRRAVAAGFRLRYADDVVIEHEPRRSARAVLKKSFRVGRGHGHLRRRVSGPARDRPRRWTSARAWRPRHGLLGVERLTEQGHPPGRARRFALDVAQYALVQLPTVLGDASADLEAAVRRR